MTDSERKTLYTAHILLVIQLALALTGNRLSAIMLGMVNVYMYLKVITSAK